MITINNTNLVDDISASVVCKLYFDEHFWSQLLDYLIGTANSPLFMQTYVHILFHWSELHIYTIRFGRHFGECSKGKEKRHQYWKIRLRFQGINNNLKKKKKHFLFLLNIQSTIWHCHKCSKSPAAIFAIVPFDWYK